MPAVSTAIPTSASNFISRLDDALPQTQCGRCGHAGCRPYAESIARGAAINRCPPGGEATLAALAALTGRAAVPLDRSLGVAGPLNVACIDETWCIGCTLCIDACPVDAICGAPKRMHVVISALCTGCELCIPPCPVACIAMRPAGRAWSVEDARVARIRYEARRRAHPDDGRGILPAEAERRQRQQVVAEALARARARRGGARTPPRSE
jgi:Na+-translocating ferredoxin:NAD+ oxidoreductase subunit B